MGIWQSIRFYGQRFMHWLRGIIIFPQLLRWRSWFENFAYVYIMILLKEKKLINVSSLRFMFVSINHQKYQLGRHPALRRWRYAKGTIKLQYFLIKTLINDK